MEPSLSTSLNLMRNGALPTLDIILGDTREQDGISVPEVREIIKTSKGLSAIFHGLLGRGDILLRPLRLADSLLKSPRQWRERETLMSLHFCLPSAKQITFDRIRASMHTRDRVQSHLEYRDKVIYPIFRFLSNTLCYPCQIPDLLFLQLDKAEEYGILELLQEALLVQFHIILEEFILETA